jgi:hypothetical protein
VNDPTTASREIRVEDAEAFVAEQGRSMNTNATLVEWAALDGTLVVIYDVTPHHVPSIGTMHTRRWALRSREGSTSGGVHLIEWERAK